MAVGPIMPHKHRAQFFIDLTLSTNGAHTIKWHPPDRGKLKINVDGATGSKIIAAGVVVRDSEGSVLACYTFFDSNWEGVNAAQEAESQAFLKGLEVAQNFQGRSITIEGDSKEVVSYISNPTTTCPWRLRSIIEDCRTLLKRLDNSSLQFVRREGNCVTHALAKTAISNRSCNVWMNSYPSCIAESVIRDKSFIVSF
ncbi:hypothetical protein BVC80_8589g4 [Macleaya cordata]|uniref:RNase H type-1 domain-containing protein n=1 Tax=Macleaya cordata TaxID=56857 RepID=A0A200RA41_MACCD|nr:hypothetical protein BVC80_8589g4 [Macleaya cordata]